MFAICVRAACVRACLLACFKACLLQSLLASKRACLLASKLACLLQYPELLLYSEEARELDWYTWYCQWLVWLHCLNLQLDWYMVLSVTLQLHCLNLQLDWYMVRSMALWLHYLYIGWVLLAWNFCGSSRWISEVRKHRIQDGCCSVCVTNNNSPISTNYRLVFAQEYNGLQLVKGW